MEGLKVAKVAEILKELDELDDCVRAKQRVIEDLRTDAEGEMAKHYDMRLVELAKMRSAIDVIIYYLDGREVLL